MTIEQDFSSSLPASVLDLVEQTPIEMLVLGLLQPKLTPIQVQTLVEFDEDFPLVIVRDTGSWGEWDGDPRFTDSSTLAVHALCSGSNHDADAGLLSEAVRVVLRDSLNVVMPNGAYLTSVVMVQAPRRQTDWATATGPVQFADLPTGVSRWETVYRLTSRNPKGTPHNLTPRS